MEDGWHSLKAGEILDKTAFRASPAVIPLPVTAEEMWCACIKLVAGEQAHRIKYCRPVRLFLLLTEHRPLVVRSTFVSPKKRVMSD